MIFREITENDLKKNKMISTESLENQDYIKMYLLYRKLFTEYIIEKLNLQEYDKKIEQSELNFKANSEEDMDIYQYYSADVLKYIYVRNNIYVEKLNEDEKKYLQEKINNNDYELKESEKDFIKNTYKKVIYKQENKDNTKVYVFYGASSPKFMTENNKLVFGIRYNEFWNSKKDDNAWNELYDKQLVYLQQIVNEIVELSKKNMQEDIRFFKYDKYSTIKRI